MTLTPPHKPYLMCQAVVFRQSRNLNGCMVMVSMSRKNARGLDLHVRAYIPRTQETFRLESSLIIIVASDPPSAFIYFVFRSNGLLDSLDDRKGGSSTIFLGQGIKLGHPLPQSTIYQFILSKGVLTGGETLIPSPAEHELSIVMWPVISEAGQM